MRRNLTKIPVNLNSLDVFFAKVIIGPMIERNAQPTKNKKKVKQKMAEQNISFKETSTKLKRSYANMVSNEPSENTRHIPLTPISTAFHHPMGKRKKSTPFNDKYLDMSTKHEEIIFNIPSTSGNGIGLQNKNLTFSPNSFSPVDSSSILEFILEILMKILKEISVS